MLCNRHRHPIQHCCTATYIIFPPIRPAVAAFFIFAFFLFFFFFCIPSIYRSIRIQQQCYSNYPVYILIYLYTVFDFLSKVFFIHHSYIHHEGTRVNKLFFPIPYEHFGFIKPKFRLINIAWLTKNEMIKHSRTSTRSTFLFSLLI